VPRPTSPTWSRNGLVAVGILLLAGNLRAVLTSVGPLVGEIRADLGISSGVAGLITTLPLLTFAALSSQAPRIARRFGTYRTLLASMVVLVAGTLLRSSGPVAALFAGTALLGLAIAAGNVLLPGLVKRHFPGRAGQMTGLYSGAMGLLATVAVGLSVPLADGIGLGWRGSLACWAAPAAVAALVWVPLARRDREAGAAAPALAAGAGLDAATADSGAPADPRAAVAGDPGDPAGAVNGTGGNGEDGEAPGGRGAERRRTRGVWGSGLAWQVTVFMGLQSLCFYSTAAWLAEILRDRGLSASSAGWVVSVMQLSVLPTALSMPLLAARRPSQRLHAVAAALLLCGAYVGLLLSGTAVLWLWCAGMGLALGALFSLSLTLFALRAPDAHSAADLSGMAQSVGYLLAAVGPTALGLAHDLTGAWTVPLVLLATTSVAVMVAGLGAGRDAQVTVRRQLATAPAPARAGGAVAGD
jgi:CP family cyanate transporter-like MFS transporter